MDTATEDIYLQKLEEFVYDEEKIVTCRWLSIVLNININESKYLLEKYVSDAKDAQGKDVSVTYLLSGFKSDDNLHITIVKGSELEEKKAAFSKIVDKQIYSIQKCKNVDLSVLSMVDHFDIHTPHEKPITGSVSSERCIKRVLKVKTPAITQKPPVQSKPSMFAKVPPKADTNNPVKKSSPVKNKHSNGIGNFLNKAATKTNTKPIVKEIEVKSESPKPFSSPKESVRTSTNKLIDSESDSEPSKSNNLQKNNSNQKAKQSVKRSKKKNNKEPPSKRHKRIIEQESDSDDIFGSDTKEDINEVHEMSEEEVPKPKVNLPLPPKNKKRKQVDRTYVDDQGYVITTKEWVEESPSEDEVVSEAIQKGVEKIEIKTKLTSNAEDKKFKKSESSNFSDTNNKDAKTLNGTSKGGKKGKKTLAANQPTLMSFFKRAV